MSDRRTFLRGLATLPLIGGSVALIGNPTKAAVPVTAALQERYIAWLANEHAAALMEFDRSVEKFDTCRNSASNWNFYRARQPFWWFPDAPEIEGLVLTTLPSTRAAIVLSAVGCPLG